MAQFTGYHDGMLDVWAANGMGGLLFGNPRQLAIQLRVTPAEETSGLDRVTHGEEDYSL
jgi:ammonia channel protein AmtB